MNNLGPIVTMIAGAAVAKNALVKLSSGKVIVTTGVATEDVTVIGTAVEAASADGDEIPVRLLNGGGIFNCIADLADLAKDDVLYTAAGGEVTDANTSGTTVGIALTASTATGDIVEVVAN